METADAAGRGETEISAARYQGAVLDLDGVITDTRDAHAAAWKRVFDEFLSERGMSPPFEFERDYLPFVDGKPRYDGVRSFLESRKTVLPEGSPTDAIDRQTVCGLGNRKDHLFGEQLRQGGARAYPETVAFVQALRNAGIPVAVASSSRNCRAVLEAAGIAGLFTAVVDGVDLEQSGLAGKPAPDMFVEATHRLQIDPKDAIGIEDASAGIAAIKAAGFGLAVGVGTGDQARALLAQGADTVVADLGELHVVGARGAARPASRLPSALAAIDAILDNRQPAVFLDYDGTLTPIVDDPGAAVLSATTRATIARLSALCAVAILSGRDLGDVRTKVGLQNIWYAGSHGFDISGPRGQHQEHPLGAGFLPVLDELEQQLNAQLKGIAGGVVERKRFAVAVHYRRVPEQYVPEVRTVVEEIHARQPQLRLSAGKKVFEFQPDVDWHKGRALAWLMEEQGLDRRRVKPLFLGDDTTDENGFDEVATDGAGIIVGPGSQPTKAAYQLADTAEVEIFLRALCQRIGKTHR